MDGNEMQSCAISRHWINQQATQKHKVADSLHLFLQSRVFNSTLLPVKSPASFSTPPLTSSSSSISSARFAPSITLISSCCISFQLPFTFVQQIVGILSVLFISSLALLLYHGLWHFRSLRECLSCTSRQETGDLITVCTSSADTPALCLTVSPLFSCHHFFLPSCPPLFAQLTLAPL